MYSAFQVAYFCGDGKQVIACKSNKDAGQDYDDNYNNDAAPLMAQNKTFEQMLYKTPWAGLPFLMQLLAVYGYEPVRNMHRRFRERKANNSDTLCTPYTSKYDQYDAVYETWSEMTGQDLTAHFDKYRIQLSSAVRQRVAAKNYPQPSVDISSVKIPVGTPLTWKTNGAVPRYALQPFKNFADAQ